MLDNWVVVCSWDSIGVIRINRITKRNRTFRKIGFLILEFQHLIPGWAFEQNVIDANTLSN